MARRLAVLRWRALRTILGPAVPLAAARRPVRACPTPISGENDRAHYEERLAEFRPPRFTRCAIAACAAR